MKLASIFTAALLLTATGAQAANDISHRAEDGDIFVADPFVLFGADFNNVSVGDVFNDRFLLTFDTTMTLGLTVTSAGTEKMPGLDLTEFSLYNAANNQLVWSGKQISSGLFDQWDLNTGAIASGSYYLQVSGVLQAANGVFQGEGLMYGAALPVPEPATYTMLLGGLAIAGAGALRRRRG